MQRRTGPRVNGRPGRGAQIGTVRRPGCSQVRVCCQASRSHQDWLQNKSGAEPGTKLGTKLGTGARWRHRECRAIPGEIMREKGFSKSRHQFRSMLANQARDATPENVMHALEWG